MPSDHATPDDADTHRFHATIYVVTVYGIGSRCNGTDGSNKDEGKFGYSWMWYRSFSLVATSSMIRATARIR
jgi:hypothetical protein